MTSFQRKQTNGWWIAPPISFCVSRRLAEENRLWTIFERAHFAQKTCRFISDLVTWTVLDSTRWFSHRRSRAHKEHRRGRLRKKCRTSSFFVPCDLDLWFLCPRIRIPGDFYTLQLTARFRHPVFNCWEVIVLTNKLTNRRRWKHPPRSAMLRRWVMKLVHTERILFQCKGRVFDTM